MTHLWKSLLNRNLLALVFFTAALAPPALEAADLCPLQDATLHGTYLVAGSGTIVGVGPISAVGEVTFDGRGNSIATYTASVNGMIHKDVTVTGAYTVNPDCTASHAESDGSHYHYVVAPDGNTVTWIETDPGTVVSGTEARLKSQDSE
jgi:hypothetical protein